MQGRVGQWPDNSKQDWSESLILLEILGQIQETNQLLYYILQELKPVQGQAPQDVMVKVQ